MKTMFRTLAAAFGILCLVFTSCTREEVNPYSNSVWVGEYPVETINGTTGQTEDHTGTIMLQFIDGGNRCRVFTSIAGLIATNMVSYDARWTSGSQVALFSSAGDQSILVYSGTVSEGIMTLQALNCDSVAASYSLTRMKLE